MKKQIFTLVTGSMLALFALEVHAQQKVKDGSVLPATSLPKEGAILELESTSKALLLPRVELTDTKTWAPIDGTMPTEGGYTVYNTSATIGSTDVNYPILPGGIGEYYWDGTGWVGKKFMAAGASTEPWYDVATNTGATLNNQNIYQMGNVGVGTTTPEARLHVVDTITTDATRSNILSQLALNQTGNITTSKRAVTGFLDILSTSTANYDVFGNPAAGSFVFRNSGAGNVSYSSGILQRSEINNGATQNTAYGFHNTLFANGAGNIPLGLTTQRNQLSIIGNQPFGTGVLSIHDVRSGSTLDNYKGFDVIRSIENLGTITNFYGYHVNVQAANEATNAWAFYNDAAIPSYFKGNVGIGTNAPTGYLQINSIADSPNLTQFRADQNTFSITANKNTNTGFNVNLASNGTEASNSYPYLSLYRTRGTILAPAALQNTDVIGVLNVDGHNGANRMIAGQLRFVAANDWSSGTQRTDLAFALRNQGAGIGANELMRLTSYGNLGIGTNAPTAKLHVIKAAADLTPAIIEGCPVFPDNAAAAALPTGAIYRTSAGVLMVKY